MSCVAMVVLKFTIVVMMVVVMVIAAAFVDPHYMEGYLSVTHPHNYTITWILYIHRIANAVLPTN